MTKHELAGRIMSLGAEASGKSNEEKIKAKEQAVELLAKYEKVIISNNITRKDILTRKRI